MRTGQCIGLVGGLGVGATVHYYRELAKAHEARARTMDILISHGETSRIFEYVEAGDARGMARYLNSFLQRLKSAGAEVGVIPAITPLYCLSELTALSPLPLVSMVDALRAELRARKARRVATFGTRYVIDSGFYGLLGGVEVVRPRPDEVDFIHSIYADLLRMGQGFDEQRRGLTDLAQTMCKRDGVDAILIAGTDLALLFDESNTQFPHVDCAAVHIAAIVKGVLDGGSSESP